MTSLDRAESPVARRARRDSAHHAPVAAEFGETLKLAVPLALTQLGQIAMMTTDLAWIGRLGAEAVAAAALGQTVSFMGFVIGMGLVSAVAPLTAQAFGADNPDRLRRALCVGLWAALFVGIPITLLQLCGETILLWLGQSAPSAKLAGRYLDGMAWAALPGLWTIAIRGFMGSVNRPAPGLWIMIAAIPANAVLAYALIYGAFGLPRLDLLGAGFATSLVSWAMCIASVIVAHRVKPFAAYRVFRDLFRIDWRLMRELAAIGLPMSGSFALEYGVFGSAALLMGLISTAALTAHQIALNAAAVLFMVPFGISMAATVRVGQAVGRDDPASARRAGFVALALGASFMTVMTLIVLIVRYDIAHLFMGAGGAGEAVELTAMLLLVGATFFIADGIQTVAAGALRGMSDTRVPMLFSAIGYWVIGFSASCLLGFTAGFGAVGVWVGLSVGTAVYAVLLVARFALKTRAVAAP